jgi:hypothetical protein
VTLGGIKGKRLYSTRECGMGALFVLGIGGLLLYLLYGACQHYSSPSSGRSGTDFTTRPHGT